MLEFIHQHDSKKNRIIASVIAVFIIIIGSYLIASNGSSRTRTVDKFQSVLNSRNPYKAYKYLVVEDNSVILNEENIKPFVDYLNLNEDRKVELIRNLRFDDSESGIMYMCKEDDKYIIKIRTVDMILSTNLKDTNIYMNDNHYIESDRDNYSERFSGIIPGTYNIKAEIEGMFGPIVSSKTVNVINSKNNVDMNVNAVKVSTEGNYSDAAVYINGEDTKKSIYQFKDVGPIQGDGTVTIYSQKDFPWGESVKSEEKKISDFSTIRLDINPMTEKLKTKLEERFKVFYNSVFNALTKSDPSLIKNASDKVSNDIYEAYSKKTFIVKNSYKLDDIKWQKDAISVEYEDGVYSAYAVAEVSYKEKVKLSIFTIKEVEKQSSIGTYMKYDVNKEDWIVDNVIVINN